MFASTSLPVEKDESILELLARLEDELGAQAFAVADAHESDRCALEIASAADRNRRVYVLTWRQPPEHFYYECAVADPLALPGEATTGVVAKGDRASFATLLDAILRHFAARQ
jgi:hypothetical protein